MEWDARREFLRGQDQNERWSISCEDGANNLQITRDGRGVVAITYAPVEAVVEFLRARGFRIEPPIVVVNGGEHAS